MGVEIHLMWYLQSSSSASALLWVAGSGSPPSPSSLPPSSGPRSQEASLTVMVSSGLQCMSAGPGTMPPAGPRSAEPSLGPSLGAASTPPVPPVPPLPPDPAVASFFESEDDEQPMTLASTKGNASRSARRGVRYFMAGSSGARDVRCEQ